MIICKTHQWGTEHEPPELRELFGDTPQECPLCILAEARDSAIEVACTRQRESEHHTPGSTDQPHYLEDAWAAAERATETYARRLEEHMTRLPEAIRQPMYQKSAREFLASFAKAA